MEWNVEFNWHRNEQYSKKFAQYNNELYAWLFHRCRWKFSKLHRKWNGSNWEQVGGGFDNPVLLSVFENELYAGISFTTAGGIAANY